MTRCMANSLARYGIQVNAIAPGIIRTDLTASCFEPGRLEQFCRKYPAGRLGEPEEIAAVMLFLASDMSSFVMGRRWWPTADSAEIETEACNECGRASERVEKLLLEFPV